MEIRECMETELEENYKVTEGIDKGKSEIS